MNEPASHITAIDQESTTDPQLPNQDNRQDAQLQAPSTLNYLTLFSVDSILWD